MFDIVAKRAGIGTADRWTLALKLSLPSDELRAAAPTKTDAVVAMREKIDEWIEGLKAARDELEAI